jgi:hypothetical protein
MNCGTAPSGETEFRVRLQSSNREARMSALGQKRTSEHVQSMSALPPKADIAERRFAPGKLMSGAAGAIAASAPSAPQAALKKQKQFRLGAPRSK